MKRISQIFCLLLLAVGSTLAQEPVVAIVPFLSVGDQVDETQKETIYEKTKEILKCNDNLKIVDHAEGWNHIEVERILQKQVQFRNTETYRQGRSLGATELMIGKVMVAGTVKDEHSGKRVSRLVISLSTFSVETGEVLQSKLITVEKKPTYLPFPGGSDILFEQLSPSQFESLITQYHRNSIPFMTAAFGGDKKDYCPPSFIPRPEPKEYAYTPLGNRLLVDGSKKDGVKLNKKYVLVQRQNYRITVPGGEQMEGTSIIPLAPLKPVDYQGTLTIMEPKDESILLDDIIREGLSKSVPGGLGTPVLIVMPVSDLDKY